MWIMWKNVDRICKSKINFAYKPLKNKVLLLSVYFCRKMTWEKRNPQPKSTENVDKVVDNVDNYAETKDSAILTMSPAPIVINKSSGLHRVNKNFSISSKVWKW